MLRRQFVKSGAGAVLVGLAGPAHPSERSPDRPEGSSDPDAPRIMSSYTSEDHRRRLKNIATCERGIRKCMRKHLIIGYIPGQVSYNLGEYPCRKPYNPDE